MVMCLLLCNAHGVCSTDDAGHLPRCRHAERSTGLHAGTGSLCRRSGGCALSCVRCVHGEIPALETLHAFLDEISLSAAMLRCCCHIACSGCSHHDPLRLDGISPVMEDNGCLASGTGARRLWVGSFLAQSPCRRSRQHAKVVVRAQALHLRMGDIYSTRQLCTFSASVCTAAGSSCCSFSLPVGTPAVTCCEALLLLLRCHTVSASGCGRGTVSRLPACQVLV